MVGHVRLTEQIVFLGLALTVMGFAQSTFGSITGSLRDPSGALVAGALIEVTNEGTGAVRKVNTSTSGVFNVPDLNLGNYKVRLTAKGFTTYERTAVHLSANQILNLDVTLTLGTTSSVIEVQTASPVINTEGHDISGEISGQALQSLPEVGRHDGGSGGIYTYAVLTTGAAKVGTSATPIIQGTRSQVGILPTMDGIAVMAYPQGAGPVQPSMEGIEELKIESAVAPAEFPTAGNIQVVTKSGGNQVHGTAFWDYNGNILNARNFFSPAVPFRVYNNFGASASGPIKKNKLFFFVDYEGSREAATTTLTESVPLPAWRTGDFSTYSKNIIDPTTKLQFPGNRIPANRISQVSQNFQSYGYPLPNNGAPGTTANNWTANFPGNTGFTHYNNIDGRGDYNITNSDVIFVRFSWRRMPLFVPGIYPLDRDQVRRGESSVLAWNHVFSPTVVNEFRFGTTYHRNFYQANVVGSDLLQQFGIQNVSTVGVHAAPYFNITGVTPWNPDASSITYQDNPETTLEPIDNLSWSRGRHFMKFGFDVIRDRFNGNNISSTAYGEYDFSGVYTGFGYADFLLGIPQTTQLSLPNPNRSLRGTTWGMYAQDQFRMNTRLTLDYGVRWELEQPYTDNHGALYTFDPATGGLVIPDNGVKLINAFFPKNIPIVTASQAGRPANSLVNTNKMNFEPRVGFAYKPLKSDNTVIRAGYGIYSNLIYATLARSQMTGGPFSGSVTNINSLTPSGVPLFSFPSPFLSTAAASTQNVNGVNPNLKSPYTQQWNLTIEHQISSVGLRISYVGSRSVNLVYRRNLNEPAPGITPFSTALYPYQRYSQVIWADSGGTDLYNALELAGQKRVGQSLTVSGGFTWAKDLTDTQDAGGGGTTFGGQIIQNQFNRDIEKSNNALVVPRRFFAYAVYTLPFGRGQHFLSNAPALVQAIVGGWRTNWTAVSQSGQYYTPSFSGFSPSNTGVFGGVPDRIGNGNVSPSSANTHLFDPTAFAIPGCPATNPVCTNPATVGRFGNSGFNILAGPPLRNLDFGIEKDFRIHDRAQMRFNMIMANALNHPNFSIPAANISSPGTVGVSSSQQSALLGEPAPREIDFGLRLEF